MGANFSPPPRPTAELPQFLRDLIGSPPRAGEGIHDWLFRVARQLHAHRSPEDISHLLKSALADCGRAVPDREIREAVENSRACAWEPSRAPGWTEKRPTWPAVNEARRQKIVADGSGLADLWELSPVRLEDNDPHSEEIIDRLFPGSPLLCCGQSMAVFDTKPRENWRGELAKLQLVVPSPMLTVEGVTKDGKPSRHTLANTGPRRFVVTEFDSGTLDEQAALSIHLAHYAPLVCALHSGGKSLHGWFLVAGQPEDRVRRFFSHAVGLGADPATWTRSQFVRMPDGTRENGRRQTVYFLNYRPLEAK